MYIFKRSISALLVATMFSTTGCIGSFKLVKSIYDFNRGVQGKFLQELVFLGLFFIPVYLVCSLGDAFIFNVIEFWTGSSPLAANDPSERWIAGADGSRAKLSRSADGRTLTIEDEVSGEKRTYTRDGDQLVIADGSGARLAVLRALATGQIEVADGEGRVISTLDGVMVSDAVRATLAGSTSLPDPLLAARAAFTAAE